MTQLFRVHPENPQDRLLEQACAILRAGGVIAYPTDSAYALACHIGDKDALLRIQTLRQLDPNHHFTLICRDLSDIATYAEVDNASFRYLKAHTPGPYTFILTATKEVPKRLRHPKRKTIGIRVPEHKIVQRLLTLLGEPIMSTTLQLPGEIIPLSDPDEIYEKLSKRLDLIIDGGYCGIESSTVIDLVEGDFTLIRQGKGEDF